MRVVLAVGGALALLTAAGPAEAAVVTFPLPGTETASPRTQISFRGVKPGELGTVRVTGSRSGRHGGRLRAHSDGGGASFFPSLPSGRASVFTVRSRARPTASRSAAGRRRCARGPVSCRAWGTAACSASRHAPTWLRPR